MHIKKGDTVHILSGKDRGKTAKVLHAYPKLQKIVVEAYVKHPKYGKFMKKSKKYKAHDEKGEYHTGDKVKIEETRPLSKDKNFRVVSKIS